MKLSEENGYLRLKQILEMYPVGRSTWWAGVRSGRYPRPVKLSSRCTAWAVKDIQALLKQIGGEA